MVRKRGFDCSGSIDKLHASAEEFADSIGYRIGRRSAMAALSHSALEKAEATMVDLEEDEGLGNVEDIDVVDGA